MCFKQPKPQTQAPTPNPSALEPAKLYTNTEVRDDPTDIRRRRRGATASLGL